MAEGHTLANAVLGAVVSVFLTFLPLSPLLGGLLAGYLEGGDRSAGLRVGAISGVFALVPIAGLLVVFGGIWTFFLVGGLPFRASAIAGVLALVVFAVVAFYTVGLSTLGGWLGNYLRTDTDLGG